MKGLACITIQKILSVSCSVTDLVGFAYGIQIAVV
jgi:hypothetical protein